MNGYRSLLKTIVLLLAVLLTIPVLATAGSHDGDEEENEGPGQRGPPGSTGPDDVRGDNDADGEASDDEEDADEDNDRGRDDDRSSGRGNDRSADRGRDRDDDDDDDGPESEAVRQDVARQIGRFRQTDSSINGTFVSFAIKDGGINDYSYRGRTIFDTIAFDPALDIDELELKGAKFEAKGDAAEFEGTDTPSGHFKAEADDGTIVLHLAPGIDASHATNGSGDDNKRIRLNGTGFTAFVFGDHLTIGNGTITAEDEVRFIVHAPGLRGHLSPRIDKAVEDGQIVAEVLVTDETAGEAVSIANGPVNLTTTRAKGSVTVTIEGHGPGRTLLFDLARDSLGRIEDLTVYFDGERIQQADDLEDILNTTADEAAEYLIIVGHNKTQVLIGIPHFSVHEIELRATGIEEITPILGSPVALVAAAAIAGLFIAVSWNIRNRQR